MQKMLSKEIERLVVVVDIRAWLLHPNPNKLASLLQQSVRTFLASMSPSCRWGFKLFDSSMSPFPSHCKINKLLGSWACSTRFDSVLPGGDNSPTLPEVLSQFCSALNCLHTELHKTLSADAAMATDSSSVAPANASFTASSLMELLSDCVWNPLLSVHEEVAAQSQQECTLAPIQLNSNLVIFFSTLPTTHSELAQYLGIESAASESDLNAKFSSTFKKVQGSFLANNIHLCWVDVPLNISSIDHDREIICSDRMYPRSPLRFLLSHLGWSFTFLDVLVMGLRMVPFSVLWQGLAHPWFHICHKPASKAYKVCVQVRDVNNKPISATLCKAEMISLGSDQMERFIHVSTLSICSTIPRKVFNYAGQHILAQAILRSKASMKGKLDKFEVMLGDGIDRNLVGDYFLGGIEQELHSFEPGKPAWQLLMLHLTREERLAIIDVGSTDSASFALLEPVTVHLAVLRIVDKSFFLESQGCLLKEDLIHSSEKPLGILDEIAKSRTETDNSQPFSVEISSQDSRVGKEANNHEDTRPGECSVKPPQKRKPLAPMVSARQQNPNVQDQFLIGTKRKRPKTSRSSKHEENWQRSGKTNLEELYTRSIRRSKVLKVLSCWMRQTKQERNLISSAQETLLAALAGRCSSAISDVFSDNPLTGEQSSLQLTEENMVGSAPQSNPLTDEQASLQLIDDSMVGSAPQSNMVDSAPQSYPLTGEQASQQLIEDSMVGSAPQSNSSLRDNSQPNIVPDVKRNENYLDWTRSIDTVVNDTILSTLPNNLATSESLCLDKEQVTQDDFALNDANAYIASLDRKIADCLSSPEIDLYSFSQRVVLDVQSAFSVIYSKGFSSEGHGQTSLMFIQPASEANIHKKVMEILLHNPKRLASKYKNCRPPKSASQIMDSEFKFDNQMYSSEEKVREHELQILFRMEIISLILKSSDHTSVAQAPINEICRLLESIQFNLPGGVLEGESLLDFSNNAIKQRYDKRLPAIVDEIYMAMEFNGHDDLSEVEELEQLKVASELVPSGSDAHDSLATGEDYFSNSDNPYSSSSQGKCQDQSRDLSLQRALFRERTRCMSADAANQKLRQAEAKRERAKRFSHFAGSCRDLLRVTVTPKVSVAACSKKHSKHHGGSSKSKPHKTNNSSEREVILQTPFSSAKQRSEKPPLGAKKKLLVWNW